MVNSRSRPLLADFGIFVAHWEPSTASELISCNETSWTLRFMELVGDFECVIWSLSFCIIFAWAVAALTWGQSSNRLWIRCFFFLLNPFLHLLSIIPYVRDSSLIQSILLQYRGSPLIGTLPTTLHEIFKRYYWTELLILFGLNRITPLMLSTHAEPSCPLSSSTDNCAVVRPLTNFALKTLKRCFPVGCLSCLFFWIQHLEPWLTTSIFRFWTFLSSIFSWSYFLISFLTSKLETSRII